MFYSHQSESECIFLVLSELTLAIVLQNSEHGVATIWLVQVLNPRTNFVCIFLTLDRIAASFGKSAQKKLSKKAIQQVNVPKACETILEPGPPLALRLQGTLLYGVSKVFLQQCGYVLTDAEKIQSDMISFFRTMQSGAIDIQNGKTKYDDSEPQTII